jgi:RNA polymerase sigma factor (sigma-70 family)
MEGVIPAAGFARSQRAEVGYDVSESVVRAYREHYVEVARLALLLVGDPDRAEDLTDQAFARLHVRWDRVMDDDRALPFLRIAIVKLTGSRRARRAAAAAHGRRSEAAAAQVTRDDAPCGVEHDRMVEALARLPRRQRTAIVLHDYVRLTDEEIASTMGCRVRAARAHLRRATTSLSTALGADR